MGGCCILSSALTVPWRWIAIAVDYRRLTCAALLLGGIVGTLYWVAVDYVGAPVFQIVGWSLIVSRCTAMLMLPTFSLCLLAACRRTMTLLRQTPLRHIIPFDDAISFHSGAGLFGVFLAIVHSLCHIVNFISAQNETKFSVMYLHAAHAAGGLVWNPLITATGGLMLLSMFVALPFAVKWPKQARWLRDTLLGQVLNNFTTFYISHQIFFFVFVVLFMLHPVPSLSHVHGLLWWLPVPYSWMWIGWPFALYIAERLYGHFRAQTWNTKIMGACILDPGVLTLEISKPPGFSYKPGQYIFLQCGDISRYEWHPFSLTSAPADNFLQVHIKDVGDWTGALHAKFRASMQVTHADKFMLLENLKSSLARRLSTEGGHAGGIQVTATPAIQIVATPAKKAVDTSRKVFELPPDRLEIVIDKNLQPTDSAEDFCGLQHRVHVSERIQMYEANCKAAVTGNCLPPAVKECEKNAFIVDPCEAALKPVSLYIPEVVQPAVPDQLEAEVADLVSHNLVVQRPLAASLPAPTEKILGCTAPVLVPELIQPGVEAPSCSAAAAVPAVPSGSYIAYELSTEYGSELQKAQAQRTKDSTEAWKGMPVQSVLHDIPEHVSAEGLQRIQALIARFRGARHAAPAEAPRIVIDGPFGAPAQEHANFSQVLLIGMGIGITPMLSIMRDALHRLVELPANASGLEGDARAGAPEQRKAYMHWVVRDPRAGGWLKSEFEVMSLLDSSGHIFRSHVHVTGNCPPGVCPSQAWKPCPDEHPNVKLTCGRPDFKVILKDLQVKLGRARVGVFLCGPPPVKREVRDLCTSLNKEGSTMFCFHAEKFF